VTLVRLGNLLFRTRNALFPVLLLGLLLVTRPVIPSGDVRLGRALDALGIAVALAGQALRVAVIGYRYIVRGGRDRQVYADDLVTSGFFALSRNPLYLGNLLILAGLFLIWNNPWLYVVGGGLFVVAYRAIVAAEEDYLGRQFGEFYAAYARGTPRWWPRLSGLGAATAGIPFNWRRVVIKEYTSTAVWMAGATVLLLIKARRYGEVTGATVRAWPYWTAVAVIAAFWGWARYLKKSKRLRE
jgi:protein-S-isoprenylcysteine O-methyltransferase Ste14